MAKERRKMLLAAERLRRLARIALAMKRGETKTKRPPVSVKDFGAF